MARSSRRMTAAVAVALVALAGCEDLHLSTGNLDIGPNPASPGDQVVASFILHLVPTQRHTIVLLIDQHEHIRETSSEAPPEPVVLELGDAADLIAAYGVGEHTVQVEVHVKKGSTHTEAVTLELREAEAAAGVDPGPTQEEP